MAVLWNVQVGSEGDQLSTPKGKCPRSRHRGQMALLTLRQGPEPNFDEADEHAERVSSEVGHCRKRRLFVADIHGDVCYLALE